MPFQTPVYTNITSSQYTLPTPCLLSWPWEECGSTRVCPTIPQAQAKHCQRVDSSTLLPWAVPLLLLVRCGTILRRGWRNSGLGSNAKPCGQVLPSAGGSDDLLDSTCRPVALHVLTRWRSSTKLLNCTCWLAGLQVMGRWSVHTDSLDCTCSLNYICWLTRLYVLTHWTACADSLTAPADLLNYMCWLTILHLLACQITSSSHQHKDWPLSHIHNTRDLPSTLLTSQ